MLVAVKDTPDPFSAWKIPNTAKDNKQHQMECVRLQGCLQQLVIPRNASMQLTSPKLDELLETSFDDKGRKVQA